MGKPNKQNSEGKLYTGDYDKQDEFGHYRIDGVFRKKGVGSLRTDRPNMYYPLYCHPNGGQVSLEPVSGWREVYPVDSNGVERRWLWVAKTAAKRTWQLHASKNGIVYVKNYAGEKKDPKRTKVRTIWTDNEFHTQKGTNEIKQLFGEKVFDTPKPIAFIEKVIDIASEKDAVILDFFAGLGTAAHATATLNKKDKGSRRCILMESNDKIPTKHVAVGMGFSTIADITEYRLRIIKGIMSNFCYQSHSIF